MSPVVGGALVAASRIVDHDHHVGDICAGSGIGLLWAVVFYHRYFYGAFGSSALTGEARHHRVMQLESPGAQTEGMMSLNSFEKADREIGAESTARARS